MRFYFIRRIFAFLIDFILLFSFIELIIRVFGEVDENGYYFLPHPYSVIPLLCYLIYFVLQETLYGKTIGKRLFKLKIEFKTEPKRKVLVLTVRRMCDFLDVFLIGVGLILILVDDKKQRLGDKITKVYIVPS